MCSIGTRAAIEAEIYGATRRVFDFCTCIFLSSPFRDSVYTYAHTHTYVRTYVSTEIDFFPAEIEKRATPPLFSRYVSYDVPRPRPRPLLLPLLLPRALLSVENIGSDMKPPSGLCLLRVRCTRESFSEISETQAHGYFKNFFNNELAREIKSHPRSDEEFTSMVLYDTSSREPLLLNNFVSGMENNHAPSYSGLSPLVQNQTMNTDSLRFNFYSFANERNF